jgi:hypothetical protein
LPYPKAKEFKSSIFILGENSYEKSISQFAGFIRVYDFRAAGGAGSVLLQS